MRYLPHSIGSLCLLLGLGLMAETVSAADKVPNPAYQNWAQFKAGSWSKVQSAMQVKDEQGDEDAPKAPKMGMTMTRKLVELTPEKAVVETTMVMNMAGQERTMPARRQEIPATIDADKVDTSMLPPETNAAASDVTQGDEAIKVQDKSLKCHWISMTLKQGEMTMQTKMWFSKEIPGGLVKSEMHGGPMNQEMSLVSYEIAK